MPENMRHPRGGHKARFRQDSQRGQPKGRGWQSRDENEEVMWLQGLGHTECGLECLAGLLSRLSKLVIITCAGFDRNTEAVFMPSLNDHFL